MKKKAVKVSEYFNPIYKWHLEYFNNAKEMAEELFGFVNNDYQRAHKAAKSSKVKKSEGLLCRMSK